MNGKEIIQVLVVEDEDVIRQSVVRFLESKAGYIDKILAAENGQKAIDYIFQYRPQVMLLDIRLPVKNGLDVMKEAFEAHVMPKTIVVSGYSEFNYAREAIRYGVVDYLVKPMRSSEMLNVIEDILRSEKLLPDAAESEPAPGGAHTKKNKRLMETVTAYLDEHYAQDIDLTVLSEAFGITPCYLSTLFKQTYGCRLIEMLNRIRVKHAREFLRNPKLLVYEVAYLSGYKDEKYFSSVFHKMTGLSPSEYREQQG
jgi:YesN/AraC family two-component response regulator